VYLGVGLFVVFEDEVVDVRRNPEGVADQGLE
jgi:hypothetical protein